MSGNRTPALRVGEGSTGDSDDVEAIIATLRHAGLAVTCGDADAVARMFAPDTATVTSFDFMRPGLTSVDDIRRNVGAIARDADGPVEMTYPQVTVHVASPDLAWSLAYGEFRMTARDGSRTDLRMSVTDIWRKRDGRWVAVHEHSSLPIDKSDLTAIPRQ